MGIGLFNKGTPENIVRGRPIKVRETHKVFYGDILKSPLVTGINGLFDTQQLAYLLLGHVHVFPKVSQSLNLNGSGKIEASFKYPSEEQEPTVLMSLNLKKGDTVQLGANGDKASWKTSQKSVAMVSKDGLVTALKKGKAVITLKCGSKTQTIEIIVE